MDSISTLNTVLQTLCGERDAARLALRKAQEALDRARQQADHLSQYRDSYRQQWSNRFRTLGSGIDVVQCYQGFSSRLDQAISQQGDSVSKAQAQLAQVHAHWLACEQKVAAIGKLIERRQAELQRISARREQRQLDEAATRMALAGHAAQMLN